MGIKDWIIKKLESDVEPSARHIDLENLDDNKRNELFKQFGEGDKNLKWKHQNFLMILIQRFIIMKK